MKQQPPKSPPKLTKHADGYYRVSWYAWGRRHRQSFGKKRTDAYDRYYRWAADWGNHPTHRGDKPARSISDLYPEFRDWQDSRSRNSKSILEYDYAIDPLLSRYGSLLPDQFTPDLLRDVRKLYIGNDWTRRTVNKRVVQVRAFWKWMVSEGYASGATLSALSSLAPLRRGEAKDPSPVKSAEIEHVEAAKRVMTPTLRAMVDLQTITGMRPGELCRMSWDEIEIHDEVWVYSPAEHKTAHHGRDRIIPIGPAGQKIICDAIGDRPRAGAVFRVARHIDESLEQIREAKRGGVEPGYLRYPYYQRLFAQARERRLQDEKGWTPNGYYQAIRAACDRAECPRWSPNQLRHLYATNMRKSVGLDRAATMLGHSKVETTQIYAEIKLQELIETAANHG